LAHENSTRDEIRSHNGQSKQLRGWRGLASFLFGPNWLDLPLYVEGDNTHTKMGKQVQTVTSTTFEHKDILGHGGKTMIEMKGWDAPYLDSIPSFPIRAGNKILPNSYLQSIGDSFHDIYAPEEEACHGESVVIGRGHIHNAMKKISLDATFLSDSHDHSIHTDKRHKTSYAHKLEEDAELKFSHIPDELFYESGVTSFWGSHEQNNLSRDQSKSTNILPTKIESLINGSDSEKYGHFIPSAPVTGKRGRFDERYDENIHGLLKKSRSESDRPAYLPKFLPMFPPERTYSNTLDVKATSSSTKDDTQLSVVKIPVGGVPSKTSLPETIVSQVHVQETYKYDQESTVAIRDSLVSMERSLGSSFWGSINGHDRRPNTHTDATFTVLDSITSDVTVPSGFSNTEQGNAVPKAHASVIPLGRASGLRVSRIIEGSLDSVIQ